MLRLTIAEPCQERWDEMTPVEKGVFCQSCKKIVTDFSGMSDEEILRHFSTQQFQPSCGRFRNDQLNRPLVYISPDVLSMDIPIWKKFLAALFICFSGLLVSCENRSVNTDITDAVVPSYATRPTIDPVFVTQEVKEPEKIKPEKKTKQKKGEKGQNREILLAFETTLGIIGPSSTHNPSPANNPFLAPTLFPKAPDLTPIKQ